jgi:hypothetical protein
MISDLDQTLEALLRSELPPGIVEQVGISFAAPDNTFPPSGVTLPAFDLFLYDVRENRDLRSAEPIIERASDGTALRHFPPVRVECSYLVTAWPSESVTNRVEDEHRLLSAAMVALLRHPRLPGSVLQGALANQEVTPPTTMLRPGSLQSVSEFWQALGGKPKAALHYTVTIAVPVRAPEVTGRPVVQSELRLRALPG